MISIVEVINNILNTLLTNQDYTYILSLTELNNLFNTLNLVDLRLGSFFSLIMTNPQIIYTFIFYTFMVLLVFFILTLPIKLVYNLIPYRMRTSFKNLRRKE